MDKVIYRLSNGKYEILAKTTAFMAVDRLNDFKSVIALDYLITDYRHCFTYDADRIEIGIANADLFK